MNVIEKIQNQILQNPIVIYMKGSPEIPSCGFSAQAVKVLSLCCKKFLHIDVLKNPDIRAALPKYSNWPTFPQLWIQGKLIGGCDIILEMYQNKKLKKLVDKAIKKNI